MSANLILLVISHFTHVCQVFFLLEKARITWVGPNAKALGLLSDSLHICQYDIDSIAVYGRFFKKKMWKVSI